MVDTVQLVLLIVIVVLTVLLIILGIQVFFIFRELRQTLSKTNKVLDNADAITENIEAPLSAIASLTSGVKAGSLITVMKFLNSLLGRESDDRRHHRD
jgi:uncharacterized protein YoxC